MTAIHTVVQAMIPPIAVIQMEMCGILVVLERKMRRMSIDALVWIVKERNQLSK